MRVSAYAPSGFCADIMTATFVKTAAITAALMGATPHHRDASRRRRGPLSAFVILSDLLLSIGGFILAHQFDHDGRQGTINTATTKRIRATRIHIEPPPTTRPTKKGVSRNETRKRNTQH